MRGRSARVIGWRRRPEEHARCSRWPSRTRDRAGGSSRHRVARTRTRQIRGPETPKATSGIPRAASANGSERWRRYEGPLGVAFLLVCARIERKRSGELAATGLVETIEAAEDRQRGRAHDGVTALQASDEPAIGRSAPRAMQPSLGREIHHAVALERLGRCPLVFEGENHAKRTRPGPPGRASMVERVAVGRRSGQERHSSYSSRSHTAQDRNSKKSLFARSEHEPNKRGSSPSAEDFIALPRSRARGGTGDRRRARLRR